MENIINNRRIKQEIKLLGTFSLISVAIYLLRVIISGEFKYLFLVWNLFLASIPWLISNFYLLRYSNKFSLFPAIISLFFWIIFLPNSPYILTDIFHLVYISRMPIWFDLFLILSFAWTALIFGFISLKHFDRIILAKFSTATVLIINSLIIFLISYGVYIGRYSRWNSWDIFHAPDVIIKEVLWDIFHPLQNTDAIGMTLLLGTFLTMVYHTLNFRDLHLQSADKNNHLIIVKHEKVKN